MFVSERGSSLDRDRQTDRQTDIQTYRQTDRQAGRHAGRQAERETDRQTDKPPPTTTDRHPPTTSGKVDPKKITLRGTMVPRLRRLWWRPDLADFSYFVFFPGSIFLARGATKTGDNLVKRGSTRNRGLRPCPPGHDRCRDHCWP